jgi:hypothetical protein
MSAEELIRHAEELEREVASLHTAVQNRTGL